MKRLKQVMTFTYLGRVISNDCRCMQDVRCHLEKVRTAYLIR